VFAVTILCTQQAAVTAAADAVASSVDASFMLFSAYLVFFMQAGFAMVRHPRRRCQLKNTCTKWINLP